MAERRLDRLDPLPDLDNANVGIYRELCGYVIFWHTRFLCHRECRPVTQKTQARAREIAAAAAGPRRAPK